MAHGHHLRGPGGPWIHSLPKKSHDVLKVPLRELEQQMPRIVDAPLRKSNHLAIFNPMHGQGTVS